MLFGDSIASKDPLSAVTSPSHGCNSFSPTCPLNLLLIAESVNASVNKNQSSFPFSLLKRSHIVRTPKF